SWMPTEIDAAPIVVPRPSITTVTNVVSPRFPTHVVLVVRTIGVVAERGTITKTESVDVAVDATIHASPIARAVITPVAVTVATLDERLVYVTGTLARGAFDESVTVVTGVSVPFRSTTRTFSAAVP